MYKTVKISGKAQKVSDPFCRILRVTYGILPENNIVAWGIDPGVNFGLTIIDKEKVYIYHGSFLPMEEPGRYGLVAFKFLQKAIEQYQHAYKAEMTIEGAAYGVPFRQVELSEIRTGFYLAGALALPYVSIVPPLSIRKRVFSSAKIQAGDMFPTLNHNAADSLSMAIYTILERRDALWQKQKTTLT